jgi:hypothetical protein
LLWEYVINLPHDPLGPLHTRLNQPVSPWAARAKNRGIPIPSSLGH